MKNPYYILWADALCGAKESHPKDPFWAIKIFQLLTFINAINFATILIWLRIFDVDGWVLDFLSFEINIFFGRMLNAFLEFVVAFWLPFIIINYIFVMRKKRYKQIMKKYGKYAKGYSLWYALISLFFGLATILTYGVIDNFGF